MRAHDVRSFHPGQVALQGVTLGMARAEIDYLCCPPRLDREGAPLSAPLSATREVHVVRARARARARGLGLANLNPNPNPNPDAGGQRARRAAEAAEWAGASRWHRCRRGRHVRGEARLV